MMWVIASNYRTLLVSPTSERFNDYLK